jgi:hypothetical protein
VVFVEGLYPRPSTICHPSVVMRACVPRTGWFKGAHSSAGEATGAAGVSHGGCLHVRRVVEGLRVGGGYPLVTDRAERNTSMASASSGRA